MKKLLVNGLYTSGIGIGLYSGLFRTIDLITYSEFKSAALLAIGISGIAYVISKLGHYE